jgi:hypothetical protein
MKIDLRNVPTRWINLDQATLNAKEMIEQFDRLGITNHQRIVGKAIQPPNNLSADHLKMVGKHFLGCSQAHYDALTSVESGAVLVLEDDALVTQHYTSVIDIPDDTDAVYLGISKANQKQLVVDLKNGWYRICGMLSAHAVLYVSERYRQYAIDLMPKYVIAKNMMLDMGLAAAQFKFNVIAGKYPSFVQSDARQSANKWQKLTEGPLVPNIVLPIPFESTV